MPTVILNTSYIDLHDLEEVLITFFQGDLDHVPEEYYNRLYMDAEDLIPGKPLLSLIDSQTMRDALWKLDTEQRMVIKAYYGAHEVSETAMIQLEKFSNYQGRQEILEEAITELGNALIKYLD